MEINNTKLNLILIILALTSFSALAQSTSGTCQNHIEQYEKLKASCALVEEDRGDKNSVFTAVFSDCNKNQVNNFKKVEVRFRHVPKDDSPLGAHPACVYRVYYPAKDSKGRTVPDKFRTVTEITREFGSKTTLETIRDDLDNTTISFKQNGNDLDCNYPKGSQVSPWCNQLQNKVAVPNEEDLNEIRKGAAISQYVKPLNDGTRNPATPTQ